MAWGLIKRFSEDVDFKVAMPAATSSSNARTQRRDYREKLLTALAAAEFTPMGAPQVVNESQFFTANFSYLSEFEAGPGQRPHLRVEVSFQTTALPAIERPIRSLLSPRGSAFPLMKFCPSA